MTERKAELEIYPEGFTQKQEKLCLQLFESGDVKFGNFRLNLHDDYPEAPLSPIYINLRGIRRFPEIKKTAVEVYSEAIKPFSFDLLADVPSSITPLVSSLSDKLGVGMISPRSEIKTHGLGYKIDGIQDADKEKTALLIDDVRTSGKSIREAFYVLTHAKIMVNDAVVLIDRKESCPANLRHELKCKIHAVFTLDQMLDFYLNAKRIDFDKYTEIKKRLFHLARYTEGLRLYP